MLVLLAACSTAADPVALPVAQSGGGPNPEAVTQSFFDDLGQALKDQRLSDDTRRGEWSDRLSNYFAPNERDDQRIALRSSLDTFVKGLSELDQNEMLTLDLKLEGIQKTEETSDRAMVQVRGDIHILITRSTDQAVVNLWSQTVGLDTIIGGTNGAVPVVRIGRSWYLTEG